MENPKTFDYLNYLIFGFKTSSPSSKIVNRLINANSPNINADDVTSNEYTQLIKNQFSLVIENLPKTFNADNITNVVKNHVDNNLGYLYVDIHLNSYFSSTGQLISTSNNTTLILENIIIGGYKKTSAIHKIDITNTADISLFNSGYIKRIAEDVINDNTNIALTTTWLRSPDIFKIVFNNSKGLELADFSVKSIENINNISGSISVLFQVLNPNLGVITPSNNILTFSGFRQPLSINVWTSNFITNMTGIYTDESNIINDIKKNLSENQFFSYNWVMLLIISTAATVGLIILIWITTIIFKRNQRRKAKNDYDDFDDM